jgi:hypothetical protein
MLHSKQYAKFCESAIGEFLHHEPLDKSDRRLVIGATRLYAYTLEILNKSFRRVDNYFWSTEIIDARLICFHMRVNNPKLKSLAIFNEVERGVPVN